MMKPEEEEEEKGKSSQPPSSQKRARSYSDGGDRDKKDPLFGEGEDEFDQQQD